MKQIEFTLNKKLRDTLKPEVKKRFPAGPTQVNYLLSTSSKKAKLATASGVIDAILYLAPHQVVSKSVNLCKSSTPQCRAGCIYGTGQLAMPVAQRAMIARTLFYLADTEAFLRQVELEIGKLRKRAQKLGYALAVRLNGTSDIAYEVSHSQWFTSLLNRFSDVQFYDYTKHAGRCFGSYRPLQGLENYRLTFSYAGQPLQLISRIDDSINISVIFSGGLPKRFLGRPVIDGDRDDLRYLDPYGVIVGLKYKPSHNFLQRRKWKANELPGFVVQS